MLKISSTLGKNLKKIRTAKKLSQGAIARQLGVHRAYISGIESGKRNPTIGTIERLALALDIKPDRLIK